MIMEKVLAVAAPHLRGKTIRDLVIGLSLIACELDTGEVGIAYVLHDGLPGGCSAFTYGQQTVGSPALDIARWIITGADDLQRAIASAVITAASSGLNIPDDVDTDTPFGLEVTSNDTVGMIGLIRPVANQLKKAAGRLIVFDKWLSTHGGGEMVSPDQLQPKLLPECDVVILSGTTTINQSVDSLLEMCTRSRDVVMVGPSTPMFPEGWSGTRVTKLAGSWWRSDGKDEIFRVLSLAGGVGHLQKYMIKKLATVNK